MAFTFNSLMQLNPSSRRKFYIIKKSINPNTVRCKNANGNKSINFTDLVFRQINLGKRKLAMVDLAQVSSKGPFINIIQEQHLLRNNKLSNLDPQHQILSVAQSVPRAAIYAHKDIPVWFNHNLSDSDIVTCLWIRKDNNGTKVMVVSCYWDIFLEEPPKKLEKTINYAKRNKYSVIIGMDWNSHTTLTGSNETNAG